jgi:hypothetical protein
MRATVVPTAVAVPACSRMYRRAMVRLPCTTKSLPWLAGQNAAREEQKAEADQCPATGATPRRVTLDEVAPRMPARRSLPPALREILVVNSHTQCDSFSGAANEPHRNLRFIRHNIPWDSQRQKRAVNSMDLSEFPRQYYNARVNQRGAYCGRGCDERE